MNDYIRQKERENLKYVDEELLVDKTGRKAFKSAAYSVGISAGFLLLSLFLPAMGPEGKGDEIISVFRSLAFWMIGYALAVTIAFLFVRRHVKIVLFMLNWFFAPAVVINALLDIKNIISGG